EPVVNHRVDDGAVAHAEALADAREQVRAVAHRLHAAGDGDVDVARRNALGREHHRLETRAADLVDGEGAHRVRKPAVKRGLPRGRLAETGAHDVAHDAFLDGLGIDAGPSDGLFNHEGAELWRTEILEAAKELAGGQSHRADDHRFTHWEIAPIQKMSRPRWL